VKWRRDTSTPARIYDSTDGRYSIVWDPSGWHLWKGRELLGVFSKLTLAKSGVRDTEQEQER
jgi:hypothetical protein